MKQIPKINFSEEFIINKYLKKLSFKKSGTFEFENDGAYFSIKKNKKIAVTSDSISEDVDFFKNDSPRSIANKIITINLSDLSAMGVKPFAYVLNLFIPKYINQNWFKVFSNEILTLQKLHNFYLLGGDLSKSEKLSLSSTFFGYSERNKIIPQNKFNLNNDIWVTGNIGDSYVGLNIIEGKFFIKDTKTKNYFLKKYYFPKPNLIGPNISNYVNSMKDISDGLMGDLQKMLNKKYGAEINLSKIPQSVNLKKLINNDLINHNQVLNSGDDYELILISEKKFRNQIINFSKKNNVKITRIGKINKNLKIRDDSNNLLDIHEDYDHFR